MRSVNFLLVYLLENKSVRFYSIGIYNSVCEYDNTPKITLKFHIFMKESCSAATLTMQNTLLSDPLILNKFQEYTLVGLHCSNDQIYP